VQAAWADELAESTVANPADVDWDERWEEEYQKALDEMVCLGDEYDEYDGIPENSVRQDTQGKPGRERSTSEATLKSTGKPSSRGVDVNKLKPVAIMKDWKQRLAGSKLKQRRLSGSPRPPDMRKKEPGVPEKKIEEKQSTNKRSVKSPNEGDRSAPREAKKN
jgi:hypothetical protein